MARYGKHNGTVTVTGPDGRVSTNVSRAGLSGPGRTVTIAVAAASVAVSGLFAVAPASANPSTQPSQVSACETARKHVQVLKKLGAGKKQVKKAKQRAVKACAPRTLVIPAPPVDVVPAEAPAEAPVTSPGFTGISPAEARRMIDIRFDESPKAVAEYTQLAQKAFAAGTPQAFINASVKSRGADGDIPYVNAKTGDVISNGGITVLEPISGQTAGEGGAVGTMKIHSKSEGADLWLVLGVTRDGKISCTGHQFNRPQIGRGGCRL